MYLLYTRLFRGGAATLLRRSAVGVQEAVAMDMMSSAEGGAGL